MFARAACAGLFVLGLLATGVRADAVLSSDNDSKCLLRIGPNLIHVTAYQARDPRAEFCRDIPDLGQVVIVLDYVDPELRKMTTDVRVIKDVGGGADISGDPSLLNDAQVAPEALDPVTETHLPARLYPTGTINFQHVFTTPGRYQGIVTVRNEHGQIYVSQFPFSVGQGRNSTIIYYGVIASLIITSAFSYWIFTRRYGAGASGGKA